MRVKLLEIIDYNNISAFGANRILVLMGQMQWSTDPMDIVTTFTGRPSGYIQFDITEAAHNWKAGEPNYGVVLLAVNEDVHGRESRDTRFYSHRHGEHQPFMTVFSSHQ